MDAKNDFDYFVIFDYYFVFAKKILVVGESFVFDFEEASRCWWDFFFFFFFFNDL